MITKTVILSSIRDCCKDEPYHSLILSRTGRKICRGLDELTWMCTNNGTDYARISAVADGTEFEHVATAANGWHAVKVGSQIGWVSGKYSEITTA